MPFHDTQIIGLSKHPKKLRRYVFLQSAWFLRLWCGLRIQIAQVFYDGLTWKELEDLWLAGSEFKRAQKFSLPK